MESITDWNISENDSIILLSGKDKFDMDPYLYNLICDERYTLTELSFEYNGINTIYDFRFEKNMQKILEVLNYVSTYMVDKMKNANISFERN